MLPRDHYLKQPFQDLTHFPQGFEKGGLSDIQARLVKKNGTLIQALCQDEVSDASQDDLHILKVISNQSAPRNPVEQAWIKYLSIVKAASGATKAKGKSKSAKPAEPVVEAASEAPAKAAPKKATKVSAEASEKKPTKKAGAAEPAIQEPVVETKKATAKKTTDAEPAAKKATAKASDKKAEPATKAVKASKEAAAPAKKAKKA